MEGKAGKADGKRKRIRVVRISVKKKGKAEDIDFENKILKEAGFLAGVAEGEEKNNASEEDERLADILEEGKRGGKASEEKENPESGEEREVKLELIIEEDGEGKIRVYRQMDGRKEEIEEYSALYKSIAEIYLDGRRFWAYESIRAGEQRGAAYYFGIAGNAAEKIEQAMERIETNVEQAPYADFGEKRIANLDYPAQINGQYIAQRLIYRNEGQQSVLESILGAAYDDGISVRIDYEPFVDQDTGQKKYAPIIREVNGIRDGDGGMFFEVYVSKGNGNPFEILKSNIGNAMLGEGYGVEIRRAKETSGGCGPASEWREYRERILESAGSYVRKAFGLDDFGLRRRLAYG
ncbi:MAG: hypothetical protein HYX24_05850 [Candidatus Aenigmarchaeota archaeon]|nr:hypothetical protein [Candidatus Aenigmarchaeota archaeon]